MNQGSQGSQGSRGSRGSVVANLANFANRVAIEHVRPEVDGGRFPIKRTVGETVTVRATVFADGHDVLAAVLRHRPVNRAWQEIAMELEDPGTDEWTASFDVDTVGWHEYQVIAWVDRFQTWRRDF